MNIPKNILLKKWLEIYLESRNIDDQYKKAKLNILSWNFWWTNRWPKQPPAKWIWYFRINKQYRAIWERQSDEFIVMKIDNHQ